MTDKPTIGLRINFEDVASPEAVYAARARAQQEADWQNLLGGPQGATPGEGSLAVSTDVSGKSPDKPSPLMEGLKRTAEASEGGAKDILDAISDAVTLGLRPGAPMPGTSVMKFVTGLLQMGAAPFLGLGAGARQAFKNAAPAMESAPVLDPYVANLIRTTLGGDAAVPSGVMPKPMTAGEVLDLAVQFGVPAMLPHVPKAMKKLEEWNAKVGERGAAGPPPRGGEPTAPKALPSAATPPGGEKAPPGGAQEPTGGRPKPGPVNINTERMNATDSVKQTTKAINALMEEQLREARKTVSHERTIAEGNAYERPLKPGFTRLYRGEGTETVALPEWAKETAGQWYTSSKSKAERFQKERNGVLKYVDIPTAEVEQYLAPGRPGEYLVPHAVQKNRGARAVGLTYEDAMALDLEQYDIRAVQNALRDLHNAAEAHLDATRKAAKAGDPVARENLRTAIIAAGELNVRDEMIGKLPARGLEARKILSDKRRSVFDPEEMARVVENAKAAPDGDPDVLLAMLDSLETKAKRKVFATQAANGFRTAGKSFMEFYINGLLSGPVSHLANMTSNTLFLPIYVEERAVAGGLRAVKRGLGKVGFDRLFPSWAAEAEGVELREAMAQVMAVQKGVMDGFHLAVESWKTEKGVFGAEKAEHVPAITAKEWGIPEGSFGVDKAVDYLGVGVRVPTRAMTAEDAFFKGVTYRMELAAQAEREGMRVGRTVEAQGGDGYAAYRKAVQDVYQHPENYPAIDAAAQYQALVNTFNNELGAAGKAIGQALDKTAVGRLIVPFQRTPTNIWKQTYHRLPVLGLLEKNFWQEVAAGGARADLAEARLATAGFIAAGVAGLVGTERITGARPKDKTAAAAWDAQGKKEYSVNVGTKEQPEWVSYIRGTEPIGTTIGVIADYATIAGRLPIDPEHKDANPYLRAIVDHPAELALGVKLAMTNLMLNQTYLYGLNNVIKALNDEEPAAKRELRSFLQGVVPYSGLLRTLRRATDDTRRDVGALTEMKELLNTLKEMTPGLSSSLPALHHHITGEEMHYPEGVVPGNTSLFAYTHGAPSEVMQEIEANKASMPIPSRWLGGSKPGTSGLQFEEAKPGEGVYLSGREYQDFLVHMTKETRIEGRTLLQALEHAVTTNTYQSLSPGPGGSRADMLEMIYRAYKSKATQTYLGLPGNEKLGQDVREHVETKQRAKLPVTNPKSPQFGGSLQR